MRIVHVSTQDYRGGAFNAAYRLHDGLKRIGCDSHMLVYRKVTDDPSVVGGDRKFVARRLQMRLLLDSIPVRMYRDRKNQIFSPQWVPSLLDRTIDSLAPDVVNLHWVNHGYLSIRALGRIRQPVVWTMHDMWPFTGGCHYAGGCTNYRGQCGACPVLQSTRRRDLSRWVHRRKQRHWKDLRLHPVAPSRWMARVAARSRLFGERPVRRIPYGLDLETFRPLEKADARRRLGLPSDRLLILFGASRARRDQRKGYDLLSDATRLLAERGAIPDAQVMIFGSRPDEEGEDIGMRVWNMGTLSEDEQIARVYCAADVFVAPSREDNLPNTVLEAAACGVPTVAFGIGGMPDMIDHGRTGYLVDDTSPGGLAAGIEWVLEDDVRRTRLGSAARGKAETDFGLEKQARAYRSLYSEVLEAPVPGIVD